MNKNWLRHAWPCGLAYLASGTALSAQESLRAALEAYPVLGISLTNVGPQNVSDALIRANMRVKEGDNYNLRMVDDDVQNLLKTGYFLNVQVTEVRQVEGVRLTYVLQAKPKLTDIVFKGNKKYSNRRLLKAVTSKIGDPLDERKLFTDVQAIKTKYQKAGYPKTEVKYVPSVEETTGRGSVTFEIVETPKVRITDVSFEGASAFTQKKLRKQIKTRRHWFFSFLTGSGTLKDEQLEDDRDKLADFYRNEGYIDFDIKNIDYNYTGEKKVKLNFQVTEGQQYKVGSVAFQGNKIFSTNQLSQDLKMPEGKTFTPKGLNKDIEVVQDKYGSQGYIDTTISAKKNPNVQTGTIDLNYRIDEKEKSYIEKIEIKGNTKTKDKVIRRELSVAPGEVFDMTEVKRSKRRLEGLQYFAEQGGVEAQPEPTDIPNRRNLQITVEEKNTGHFSLGAGFSSIDSVIGFVEVTQGNFDIAKPPWFMGGGQKFRMRIAAGPRRQDYEITFIEPWFLERKLQLSTDLYHRRLSTYSDEDLYDLVQTGARLGFTRSLWNDNLIGNVNYNIENRGLVDIDRSKAVRYPGLPDVLEDQGYSLLSKFGGSLAYDTRDNALLPTKGQRTEISADVAAGVIGSDWNFYKFEARSSWYFKGLDEGHLLEVIGRTGVAETFGDSDHLHVLDRFFLGGMYSLRGYRYHRVGPTDRYGEPYGGNTYWFGSLEYSIPVIERLRLAAFYDIGMVYLNSYQWNFGNYNDNVGIGIRLNLPIGPLRLDYGIPLHSTPRGPLTPGNDSSTGRFQFGVGYTREF